MTLTRAEVRDWLAAPLYFCAVLFFLIHVLCVLAAERVSGEESGLY